MPSPSTPHLRHTAPLAHTLSPLAAAVLLLACGSALAQGTPADTAAPKAQDDTTTSAMQSFTATRNHRFNDDWSVRNVTRAYDYRLDRYNTPPGGTTAPPP